MCNFFQEKLQIFFALNKFSQEIHWFIFEDTVNKRKKENLVKDAEEVWIIRVSQLAKYDYTWFCIYLNQNYFANRNLW